MLMQFKHVGKFLKKLDAKFNIKYDEDGNEDGNHGLVFSVVLKNGDYYVGINVEESTTKTYIPAQNASFCKLEPKEYNDDIDRLINKLVPLFEEILFDKEPDYHV